MTTALSSTRGVSWRLTLDAANRVTTLSLPERTTYYTYDSGGRVATATIEDAVAGTTSMRSHTYDAQGRLSGIAGSGRDVYVTHAEGHVHIADGDEVFECHLGRNGQVTSVRQGMDPTIWVERDDSGDIVAISDGYRAVRFGRDALGRILEASFGDGDSARYFYDDLGNRTLAEHGGGSSVVYAHDARGSIETTGWDGAVQQPTVILETAEPVERMAHDGSLTLSVDYGTREYGFWAWSRRSGGSPPARNPPPVARSLPNTGRGIRAPRCSWENEVWRTCPITRRCDARWTASHRPGSSGGRRAAPRGGACVVGCDDVVTG